MTTLVDFEVVADVTLLSGQNTDPLPADPEDIEVRVVGGNEPEAAAVGAAAEPIDPKQEKKEQSGGLLA